MKDVLEGDALKVDESRPVGCLHTIGIIMGVLTFAAGLTASIAMYEMYLTPLPIVAFISYLLCASDRFYVRHRGLIAAGGAITAVAGVVLPIALLNYPPIERSLEDQAFMAGLVVPLIILAGLWLLADAAVLFMRLWQTRKASV